VARTMLRSVVLRQFVKGMVFHSPPAMADLMNRSGGGPTEFSRSPREAATEREAATKRIPVVLRQATRLLRKRLDPLMVPFKATNPEFYAQYKAARRIVKPGTAGSAKTRKNQNLSVSQPTAIAKAA